MRYAVARFEKEQREMVYRIYITDSLYYQSRNKMLDVRYFDLIHRKNDNRSGEEIANDLFNRMGLEVTE